VNRIYIKISCGIFFCIVGSWRKPSYHKSLIIGFKLWTAFGLQGFSQLIYETTKGQDIHKYEVAFKSVEKWTSGIPIFELDYLIIPVHESYFNL